VVLRTTNTPIFLRFEGIHYQNQASCNSPDC
jgi:hypothetical protein